MKTLLSPLGDKPVRMVVLIFVAMVAARIAGEFGAGFIDGLVAEFSNGV